ncbi:MAG TPA: Holliday junction resolvase RuvX [Candidatus Moranbacteria bacterium]|nr:Holliday junction resolvase RuvX [Candidatus Moranbacteria bacterium]
MKKSIHATNRPETSHIPHLSNSKNIRRKTKALFFKKEEKDAGQVLGIDFGKAKVGLALADTETKIAFAYDTIKNDRNLLVKLLKIIKKEEISKAVIGLPRHALAENEDNDQKALGKLLTVNAGIDVEYEEEMFTTKMAQANLKEKGARNLNKLDDKEAAKIILQEWLDKQD